MEILFVFSILNLNLLINMDKERLLLILIILEVFMSLMTMIFYKVDKTKARQGKWRTKEKTLLILPWLMGGFGGFVGIYGIRHKTRHWYFVMNNVFALIVQISIFISIYILM